jgi:succinate dehydrogenase / fumarate reductase membrane anchor subunit
MVNNYKYYKGAFGHTGVFDWLVQRKTAVIILAYIFYIAYFFVSRSPVQFEDWIGLFESMVFRVVSFVVFISLLKHAWVGVWTIVTDYIHNTILRITILYIFKILLLFYLIWAILILF